MGSAYPREGSPPASLSKRPELSDRLLTYLKKWGVVQVSGVVELGLLAIVESECQQTLIQSFRKET